MADLDLVATSELIMELIARCDTMVLYYSKEGDHMPDLHASVTATCYLEGDLPTLLAISEALGETLCADPAELEDDQSEVFREKLKENLWEDDDDNHESK